MTITTIDRLHIYLRLLKKGTMITTDRLSVISDKGRLLFT